jgi:hypothetical protein
MDYQWTEFLRRIQEQSKAKTMYYSIDTRTIRVLVESDNRSKNDMLEDKLSDNEYDIDVQVETLNEESEFLMEGLLDFQCVYSDNEWREA